MVEQRLDRALRAVGIPIIGVSVGLDGDRTTWRIDYAPAATVQHRVDGDALRLSFDPLAQAVVDAETTANATSAVGAKDLLATLALLLKTTDATWGSKTVPQRIAAVQTAANDWRALRAFAEKNL